MTPRKYNATPSLNLASLQVGHVLPEFIVDVTRTLIVGGAFATRDVQDVHHDPVITAQRGFKDIFMNNFTTMALVTRYLNDWAGPQAVVQRFSFKLGTPQYAQDALRFRGTVQSVESGADKTTLAVEVTGTNSGGTHLTSVVHLALAHANYPA